MSVIEKNQIYTEMVGAWELNQDMYESTDLSNTSYLDKLGATSKPESNDQYQWRIKNVFNLAPVADIVDMRVENIFRSEPKRDYEDSPYFDFIDRFIKDVDSGGTDMTSAMRQALTMSLVNGCDIVVDKKDSDLEPRNRADEVSMGLMPYIQMFSPIDRYNWDTDHAGNYNWVTYYVGTAVTGDDETKIYLTLDRDGWQRVDETGDLSKELTGTHSLKKVPVFQLYYKRSMKRDYPATPISLLTVPARIARYILNISSQMELDHLYSMAMWLITGSDGKGLPDTVSPGAMWAIDQPEAKANSLSTSTDPIKAKLELIEFLINRIMQIGYKGSWSGELSGSATSGVQVAVERTDLDSELTSLSNRMEACEKEIVRMAVSRYEGRDIPLDDIGYDVVYNTEFVTQPASVYFEALKVYNETGYDDAVPGLAKQILRKGAAKLFPSSDNDLLLEIFDEIDGLEGAIVGGNESNTESGQAEDTA